MVNTVKKQQEQELRRFLEALKNSNWTQVDVTYVVKSVFKPPPNNYGGGVLPWYLRAVKEKKK